MRPRALILAFQFLTRLPMPAIDNVVPRDLAGASVYYPLVGAVIGTLLSLLMWVMIPSGPWIAAVLVVIAWVWITGALHLDGLGDVADALGAAHAKPERFFDVLKDAHAGNFAVTAITLQVIAKLVFIAHLPAGARIWSLALIPAWSRWGALVWSATLPPLKPGLAANLGAGISKFWIVAWALALSAASFLLAPILLAALIVVPALGFYWRWRLGGITGDCLGASIETTETLLLLAVVIASQHVWPTSA